MKQVIWFGRWVPIIWKKCLGCLEKEAEGFSKMLVHMCQTTRYHNEEDKLAATFLCLVKWKESLLCGLFRNMPYRSIIDKYQHMHFFTFNTVLV